MALSSMESLKACQTETELDEVLNSTIPDEELYLLALRGRVEILDRISRQKNDAHEQDNNVSYFISFIYIRIIMLCVKECALMRCALFVC